ncbi:MAG: HAD family hydrolase [Candidatus Acidiferrales bacterium]
MTEISCAAFLFDMDGVLIDSTPAVARVWSQWAARHGFDPEEVVERAHGRPSITTVREYLPAADASVQAAENTEIERCEIADLQGVVPLPGALELLQSLPRARWAIVTSCTRALAEVRLRAAGLPRPDSFVTSSDIERGKPAPDPYLQGARKLGFAAKDCVVVEDAPAGVISGKAAGSRVLAVGTTSSIAILREAGADWILRNCSDLHVVKSLPNENLRMRFE